MIEATGNAAFRRGCDCWLSEQVVPEDERLAIERHLREFDRLGEDLSGH